jgi:hypothetical protein
MKKISYSNTKRIALNGILLALSVIILIIASVVPTSRLSLFALSSFFTAVIVTEFGTKNGCVFYISSSLLAVILIPEKAEILPYVIFFGIYGLIKYYIERLDKIILEYFLKLVYFNISLAVVALLIKQFFLDNIKLDFPWWAVIIVLEVVFIIYDYVYTLFIQYYKDKLRKVLKI